MSTQETTQTTTAAGLQLPPMMAQMAKTLGLDLDRIGGAIEKAEAAVARIPELDQAIADAREGVVYVKDALAQVHGSALDRHDSILGELRRMRDRLDALESVAHVKEG